MISSRRRNAPGMWRSVLLVLAIAAIGGCARPAGTANQAGEETPISDADAARLSGMFDIALCPGVTRLRDVRAGIHLFESWRVPEGEPCASAWGDRWNRYTILRHLDVPQAERDRLPWLCSEAGGHVAQCESQGMEPVLLMQHPRDAPFFLLRRVTTLSK